MHAGLHGERCSIPFRGILRAGGHRVEKEELRGLKVVFSFFVLSQLSKSEGQIVVNGSSARRALNKFSQSVCGFSEPALKEEDQTLDFLGGQIMRIEGGSDLNVTLRFREVPAFEVADGQSSFSLKIPGHCCPAKLFLQRIASMESASYGSSWIFRFELFQAEFLQTAGADTGNCVCRQ